MDNSTVLKSGCRFGGWQEEDEVRGVVYFVKNDDEESILRGYIGAVEMKDAEFQMCAGGILGKRDWIIGKVFTSTSTEEHEEGMREERRERPDIVEEETGVREDIPKVPRQGFEDKRTPSTTPMIEEDIDARSEYCFKDALRLTADEASRDPDERLSLLKAIRSTPPRDQMHKADVDQVRDAGQKPDNQEALEATMSRVIEAGESSQQRRTPRDDMNRTTQANPTVLMATRKCGVMKELKNIVDMFEKKTR
jgi:hypothetical protein